MPFLRGGALEVEVESGMCVVGVVLGVAEGEGKGIGKGEVEYAVGCVRAGCVCCATFGDHKGLGDLRGGGVWM